MSNLYLKLIVLGLAVRSSAAQSCGPGDSDTPTAKLADWVMLSDERKRDSQLLVRDVEELINARWPDSRLALYGSMVTGLAHRDSDVDMFVLRRGPGAPGGLHEVRELLAQQPDIFANLTLVPVTTIPVPVMQFDHTPSRFHVDVNMATLEGIVNSELAGYLLGSRCKQRLTLIIRYWGLMNGICGHGLLPSYGIALLVIFYLQHKLILPPVSLLQENATPLLVEHWNMGYDHEIVFQSRVNESLYELLGGFFEFYEEFDFDANIVSTFVGYPVKRELFGDLKTVPAEFPLYVQNLETNTTLPLDIGSSVCLQDPFQHNKNVGAHLDNSPGFRDQINRAALNYREKNETAFLEEIVLGGQNFTDLIQ